jgi:hypothetical protein
MGWKMGARQSGMNGMVWQVMVSVSVEVDSVEQLR